MESYHDTLTGAQATAINALIDDTCETLQNSNSKMDIREIKSIMYFSDLHKDRPLPYKALSDLETEKPEMEKSQFKDFILSNFAAKPPSVDLICLVIFRNSPFLRITTLDVRNAGR